MPLSESVLNRANATQYPNRSPRAHRPSPANHKPKPSHRVNNGLIAALIAVCLARVNKVSDSWLIFYNLINTVRILNKLWQQHQRIIGKTRTVIMGGIIAIIPIL